MKKRVYCLYRVSTKGQVEKDDIPMQKQRCHEFAEQNSWEIVREFSEKGVSGFKVSAKDRDAIQEIQRDAKNKKFDILLVFMFDRLGRKDDETPFVVEWFARNGIEIWSAIEGQQRFDNHVDKLLNYIRYWQASGESLKTSVRTKTRLGQIVQEGRFRGGCAPYGYQLIKKGRIGKKNRELYDIEIYPPEAETVRTIFSIAERYGFGGRRIASELKEKGIVNERTGEPFHYSSIQNILKNIMYMGILRSGETHSEIFTELQIITPEQFERVRKEREQRSAEYDKKCAAARQAAVEIDDEDRMEIPLPERSVPKRNCGKALLSGNIYCGHCGGRMFASTARRAHHPTKADTPNRVPIYKCYNRTQHKGVCDGPTTYVAEKVDCVIEELLRGIFEKSKEISESTFFQEQTQRTAEHYSRKLMIAKADYEKAARELSKWGDLMLASIEGKCAFSPEQIRSRMDVVQASVQELKETIQTLEDAVANSESLTKEIQEQHRKILSWAELYDSASPEEKKMVASYLIKAVTLTRGYGIQVAFQINEAQFLHGMDMS